ncbi:MAG: ABC transporter ATP-binding protein [Candidatus Wallbacteria bacterium]|nr:ABC transporter ATP-binding protein [Candidatus Wallbacteria bacterium]
MIELRNVSRQLPSGDRMLAVLDGVDLTIPTGQFACVVGPSGSGKSTLLGLVAGIDRPSAGTVAVAGQDYAALSEDALAAFRGRSIGIVFQSFHLIPTMTAQENVQVPLELLGLPDPRGRAAELLERVGLAGRASHYPVQLSGGEQQRVAIARAFVTRPAILLADEPTGNLDSANGEAVLGLLREMHRDARTTLLVVTHERAVARQADRVITLVDGKVASDGRPEAA